MRLIFAVVKTLAALTCLAGAASLRAIAAATLARSAGRLQAARMALPPH